MKKSFIWPWPMQRKCSHTQNYGS